MMGQVMQSLFYAHEHWDQRVDNTEVKFRVQGEYENSVRF